ncbi:methyltransferase domain-containing protein [uncultured Endozoicomonas sp.]
MALDYGCGTGVATTLLKDTSYEVEGMDIEPNMLSNAITHNP